MENYSVLTLGNLLDWLTAQPADTVIPLDPNLSEGRTMTKVLEETAP